MAAKLSSTMTNPHDATSSARNGRRARTDWPTAVVALFAVGLVMVSTTRAEPPQVTAGQALPYGRLMRAAPIAVLTCARSSGGGNTARMPSDLIQSSRHQPLV